MMESTSGSLNDLEKRALKLSEEQKDDLLVWAKKTNAECMNAYKCIRDVPSCKPNGPLVGDYLEIKRPEAICEKTASCGGVWYCGCLVRTYLYKNYDM